MEQTSVSWDRDGLASMTLFKHGWHSDCFTGILRGTEWVANS